jgi:hypothetical protein
VATAAEEPLRSDDSDIGRAVAAAHADPEAPAAPAAPAAGLGWLDAC